MSTLVSRNTIKLASNASSVNNYYSGYTIILTRINQITGKELVQKKKIVSYSGADKVATIEGLWDADFIPANTDSYQIVPTYPDSRVSINPAIQSLDYITSETYGRGLDPIKDLRLTTWLQSGRDCDQRSDIIVKLSTSTMPSVNDVYRYPSSGNILWQGRVAEIFPGNYVRFTSNIGKLTNKWNNWKTFTTGQLVYHNRTLYSVTNSGVITTEPTGGSSGNLSVVGSAALTRRTGVGPASIGIVTDGNPIRFERNGAYVSGYTLYDSDGVDYWRLLGWDSHDQRSVTRHQCNIAIDTSLPLFDNMNSLLDHFGGILRYNGDKYELEVEQVEGDISNSPDEPRNITQDNIIGKLRLSDEGIRGAYNSLTVSYPDPANKFEARNISFFNSDFLKADRNVPRKGNISIPGITNYYNTRLTADRYLARSRYGLSVNFNMDPRGQLLLPGKVIQLQHPRYGWVNKKFRISDLIHSSDCTVDIVAGEYDDTFYAISNVSKQPGTGLAAEAGRTTLGSPTGLTATSIEGENEIVSGVELKWVNSPNANASHVQTEVYASRSNNLYLNITTITNGSTFSVDENHGLLPGDIITSKSNENGLVMDRAYYIKAVSAPNQFTLSESRGGTELTDFVNGSALSLMFLTATMIALVPAPENTYVDMYAGNDTDRVEKFYWIRYRITENG